jgi:hypothetical protein
LVHVDERRKLAVLSGPLNLISSQDQTKAHDEFDVFDTERFVIVPLDYLASVVLRLDFKWRRAHPYKVRNSPAIRLFYSENIDFFHVVRMSNLALHTSATLANRIRLFFCTTKLKLPKKTA